MRTSLLGTIGTLSFDLGLLSDAGQKLFSTLSNLPFAVRPPARRHNIVLRLCLVRQTNALEHWNLGGASTHNISEDEVEDEVDEEVVVPMRCLVVPAETNGPAKALGFWAAFCRSCITI